MSRVIQLGVTLLLGLFLSATVNTVHGQTSYLGQEEAPEWKAYVMDGENFHYVHARQVSPTKLILGLLDDDSYISLENENELWHRGQFDIKDELICKIEIGDVDNEYFFCRSYEGVLDADTIGSYNPVNKSIINKDRQTVGSINDNGLLVDANNNKVILRMNDTNKIMSSFYYLWFYLPEKEREKAIKSMMNSIN